MTQKLNTQRDDASASQLDNALSVHLDEFLDIVGAVYSNHHGNSHRSQGCIGPTPIDNALPGVCAGGLPSGS